MLERWGSGRYIGGMAKALPTGTETVFHDPETGRAFTLRGFGSMKPLDLREDIDLTKPIWEQAIREPKSRKASQARGKR